VIRGGNAPLPFAARFNQEVGVIGFVLHHTKRFELQLPVCQGIFEQGTVGCRLQSLRELKTPLVEKILARAPITES
jgi:hypothetical protein